MRRLRFQGTVHLLPNLFTAANFLLGVRAITLVIIDDPNYRLAAYCLFLAMIFDVFDGLLARMTNTVSRFGMEFDSLADVVSFGVAPAAMVYRCSLALYDISPWRRFGHVGFFIVAIYAGCAALRLARYNSRIEDESKSFSGIPSPGAAGLIASYFLLVTSRTFPDGLAEWLNMFILPLMTAAVGLLMVSTVRYPAPAKQELWRKHPFLYLPVAVLAIMLVIAMRGFAVFPAFAAYTAYGIIMHVRRRRSAAARSQPAPYEPAKTTDHASSA